MAYTLRNDFKTFGYFHLLPEFEINIDNNGGKLRHIRLAFLAHELWITVNEPE
jgi:hypothetical protein